MEKKYLNDSDTNATQKSDKNVSFSHLGGRPLTRRLDEVRKLYDKGFISAKSIALKMGLSVRSAERYLKRLRDLGLADLSPNVSHADPRHSDTKPTRIRKKRKSPETKSFSSGNQGLINVHAQRWRLFVHWKSDKYLKDPFVFVKNFPDGEGGFVSVSCQNDFISVRCDGQKFWASSEESALWKSLDFWQKVVLRIEDRFGVVVMKPNSPAMSCTYYEFETSDSIVCRDAADRGEMMRVFHKDGKLRATTDMSDGYCHETHRKKSGMQDSEVWNEHVNFVMDGVISMEEIGKLVQYVMKAQIVNVKQIKELSEGMAVLVALMAKK